MNVKPLADRLLVKRVDEVEAKKGDKILIGKYSGTEVKIEGDEFVILREDDVLAIVG